MQSGVVLVEYQAMVLVLGITYGVSLTGKYLDVLITDENTATAVLDLYQSKNNIDTERKDGALQ